MCFVSAVHIITYLFMYIRGTVIKCRLKGFIKSFKKCMYSKYMRQLTVSNSSAGGVSIDRQALTK